MQELKILQKPYVESVKLRNSITLGGRNEENHDKQRRVEIEQTMQNMTNYI
jgi:hypothetical protein